MVTLIAGPHTLEGPDSFLNPLPYPSRPGILINHLPDGLVLHSPKILRTRVPRLCYSPMVCYTLPHQPLYKHVIHDVLIFMCTDFGRVS
jgi:hypothetical protein